MFAGFQSLMPLPSPCGEDLLSGLNEFVKSSIVRI